MKRDKHLSSLANRWLKAVGKKIIIAYKYLYRCEDKLPQQNHMHILKTENTSVIKPHARVAPAKRFSWCIEQWFLMWQTTKRPDHLTSVTNVGSTKCWSARSTTWHARGVEESQIHLHAKKKMSSHPRCQQGLKLLSPVWLTRWSCRLASWAACPGCRYKRGLCVVNKAGLTYAQCTGPNPRTQTVQNQILLPRITTSALGKQLNLFSKEWHLGHWIWGRIKWGATYKALIIRQEYNRCSMN